MRNLTAIITCGSVLGKLYFCVIVRKRDYERINDIKFEVIGYAVMVMKLLIWPSMFVIIRKQIESVFICKMM